VAVCGLNNGSVSPRWCRWRPTPQFYVADAGGVTKTQTCVGGGAPAAKLSARYIDVRNKDAPLNIHRAVLLLLRQRRGVAGPGTTAKYLLRTASGAAGNGLGATIKWGRGAAGIGLDAKAKYL
jgi:hypothetical protein